MFSQVNVSDQVPREERRRVMLPARMRSASGWSDACILNISSRGLLVFSKGTAEAGSFVEIRRGGQLVVARVVWKNNQRIGLFSPDPVRIEDIISNETAAAAVQSSNGVVERRRIPRTSEQSRERARAMEFMATLLVGVALAVSAVFYMHQILSEPLALVQSKLAPR